MLQDLGKSNCGLRVSGKEKKVEGRRGKGRTGKSLEDRTGQKRKENRQGCRVWGRMWQVGGRGPDGKRHREGKKAVVAPALGCSPMVALAQLFWRC